MKVSIKRFNVAMEIKNRGIEFEVRGNNNEHRGDLVLTKTRLIWCPGQTKPENGYRIEWDDFIALAMDNGTVKGSKK